MIHVPRWKIWLVLVVCTLAVAYSLPNAAKESQRQWLQSHLPAWMPMHAVSLGLDLRGGSHLQLQADIDSVIKTRSDDLRQEAMKKLREEKINYLRVDLLPQGIHVDFADKMEGDKAAPILRQIDADFTTIVSDDGKAVEMTLGDVALKKIGDQTIDQSIEIVRRRVDESGTKEPVIQRQGTDRIIVQLPGIDNPQRVKDLIGRTAKLGFHLVDDGTGTRSVTGSMELPMVENAGQTIPVSRRPMVTGDMLTNAQVCNSQFGDQAVCFNLNAAGATRFCDVTRKNLQKPFAIVLDDKVISAPTIQSPICGGSGQITGRFTVQEAADLALLLRAGALPAPLKVMEERTVGPSLGSDSVQAGKLAGIVGLGLVALFMVATYGLFGMIANVALVVNIAMTFTILTMIGASLTLPGIAGMILTFGVAVDANILIFERMREEMKAGRSLMSAIQAGHERAMATIIDSHLTALIAAIILGSLGTGPIKGFAVTLGIGITTSFFTAVTVTHLMIVCWLKWKKAKALPFS
jgi:preprotein translocase subunit SecD